MRKWLLRILLVCVIFIVIWAGMLMLWQSRNQIPDTADVLLYLVALPIAAVATLALGAKLLRPAPAAPESAAVANAEDSTPVEDVSAKQERLLTLTVLASALRSPYGQSAQELSEALAANAARPALDPELTDADGFPVLTSRVSDVDEEAQRELLAQWQSTHALPELAWSSEQLRAVSMAAATVVELGQLATAHPLLETYVTAKPAEQASVALPTLQFVAALPISWEQAQRQAVSHWLLDLIEQQGWPQEKIVLSPLPPGALVGPLAMIDRLSTHAHRQAHPCLGILIACESHIGEQTVAVWEGAGKLFSAKNEAGQIPGEGAAGLLLADTEQAALLELDTAARMHRVSQGRRDKSADAHGRVSADLLTELVNDALGNAGTPVEQFGLIAADTDHRPSRMGELISVVDAAFPELDLKSQCVQVAVNCGTAGAVSSLIALSLAHHNAVANESCALCISNHDGHERAAVVISPKSIDPAAINLAA